MNALLRRLIPWWLLAFINRRTHTCWANMASWKMGLQDELNWRVHRSCWDGPGEGYDYCGRWQKREDMKL